MSCYTLFKGWLLLSLPIGFIALLVYKRAPFLDSVTFPLVLKYVGSKDWDTQKGVKQSYPVGNRAYYQILIIQWNQPP